MIRYVLAVLLTVAILALSMGAIDQGARMNTERQLDAGVSEIDEAATSLAENEELSPAGHPDPQRVVHVQLPRPSLTAVAVDHVELAPTEDELTVISYVLEDGTTGQHVLEERIVAGDPTEAERLEFGGAGVQELRLVLVADEDGEPIVVVNPAQL